MESHGGGGSHICSCYRTSAALSDGPNLWDGGLSARSLAVKRWGLGRIACGRCTEEWRDPLKSLGLKNEHKRLLRDPTFSSDGGRVVTKQRKQQKTPQTPQTSRVNPHSVSLSLQSQSGNRCLLFPGASHSLPTSLRFGASIHQRPTETSRALMCQRWKPESAPRSDKRDRLMVTQEFKNCFVDMSCQWNAPKYRISAFLIVIGLETCLFMFPAWQQKCGS